jgi:site-specific recombinase XerD
MLHIQKRGRIWWVVGQVNRRRVHQSLRTTDRTVAESLKRDLELQVLSGGRLRRVLWPDFADEFERWIAPQVKPSTLHIYRRVVARFGKFVEESRVPEVSGITPAVIAEYTENRKKDRHPTRGALIGYEGIKADLRVLHRVFVYAIECGYLLANPVHFKRLSAVGGKTLPFNEEELVKILDDRIVKRRPYLRAIVLTFLFTGMRISDVIRLPLKALEVPEGGMILRTMKWGRTVTLGLHSELRAALDTHLAHRSRAQRNSAYVFATTKGGLATSVDTMLRRLFDRCGIEKGSPHRFRDTFAVRLLAQGASLYDVAKMLGIDISTAERHYAPYVRELQERATRLISQLSLPGQKVVQFQVPHEATRAHFGQTEGEDKGVAQAKNRALKS